MLSTIFTIAAVHLIALMSPGPDCFIVMRIWHHIRCRFLGRLIPFRLAVVV